MSTIATVVILAGAGMAGANVAHGRQVAEQAAQAITGGSVSPPAGATGSGQQGSGDSATEPGTAGGGTGTHNGGSGTDEQGGGTGPVS
jgi:hypothetical protein